MRSTIRRKLASTLLATSLGVGWVTAGNLDQLNYVGIQGNSVPELDVPPDSNIFPDNPGFSGISGFPGGEVTPLLNSAVTLLPETFIQTTGADSEDIASISDDSATWIRGWLEPPETGEYTFWVTGRTRGIL